MTNPTNVRASILVDTILNHPAPKIEFQYSLGKNLKPNFYKNKILVLDFWATWCAPCVAGFPRFNEFSKKFANNEVAFANITNEPLVTVNKFFLRTKKKLDAIKLIDTTKSTMNAFGVLTPSLSQGIPFCVIIDKNNIVKWAGNTFDLSEEILRDIINSKPIITKPPSTTTTIPNNNAPINKFAFFSFNVTKADTGKNALDNNESYRTSYKDIIELTSKNKPFDDLIELLTGVNKVRFRTNNIEKLKQHIGIEFKIGSDTTRFQRYKNTVFKDSPRKNFIIDLLSEALKFNVKTTSQKIKHYELQISDSTKLNSFKSLSPKHHSFDFDHYPNLEIIGYNLNKITGYIESTTKYIITTQIKDENLYDFSLDVQTLEILKKSLSFHGLKLSEANDAVQLLDINFY